MSAFVGELQGLLGADRVSLDESDLDAHSFDHLPAAWIARRAGSRDVRPECVVRPQNTGEVASILAIADRRRIPVVPYGTGSGVCGGIAPRGALVLDMSAMNRMIDLDDVNMLVRVEAGMTGNRLAEALAGRGFTLGHEPQSIAISTVGGWVATLACGQLSARYGGIEDVLVSLEAVLPGGRVVGGKTSPRRAAGPNVASLMIGSEGTLGVLTEATLRFAHLPSERIDRCLRFEHMADGVGACRRLAQSDLHPTLVRLYDADDASIFLRHHPDQPGGPLLLLSFDGFDAERRADAAVELCDATDGDAALVAHWWAHRNDAVDEYRTIMSGAGLLGPHGLVDTIEVSGTWTVLRALYHSIKDALGGHAHIVACHLSHIYPHGACLYFTVGSACESDAQALELDATWWRLAMEACLQAGGSISHHHGIGRVRAPWLAEELGEWLEILKAVKKAIDPNGIMNPGALGL